MNELLIFILAIIPWTLIVILMLKIGGRIRRRHKERRFFERSWALADHFEEILFKKSWRLTKKYAKKYQKVYRGTKKSR